MDRLLSSEIDRFLDNSDLSSDEEVDSDEEYLDRCIVYQMLLENSDVIDGTPVDVLGDGNEGLRIGLSDSDEESVEHLDIEQIRPEDDDIDDQVMPLQLPPAIIIDRIDDIIEQVVRGELGLALEDPYKWECKPNEPNNIVFSGQNVGINIPNPDQLLNELNVFEKLSIKH